MTATNTARAYPRPRWSDRHSVERTATGRDGGRAVTTSSYEADQKGWTVWTAFPGWTTWSLEAFADESEAIRFVDQFLASR